MAKRLVLIVSCWCGTLQPSRAAEPDTAAVEQYLHEGRFAEGETAMLLALDANPADDEARFGLGVLQFLRAVQHLGQALYEYGAVSESSNQPFLRLPVPENETPATLSYAEFGRVLDGFATDLLRAEATLAGIKDDEVKLRLRLSRITFDFAGTGEDRTTLIDLVTKLNGRPLEFAKTNPDFRVHFDRGDVAWLRAYCHLLASMVDVYRAVDAEAGFAERVAHVFPKAETLAAPEDAPREPAIRLIDPPRLRRMRLHLIAVCELNHETWTHIRREADDDYEWLPHPKQTDYLGLPITDELIDRWLVMMQQFADLLQGERLLPGSLLRFIHAGHDESLGLNVRTLLDDPPLDLFNAERIDAQGIAAKYLEPESGRAVFDVNAIFGVGNLLSGPFGFARALRLN